MKDPQILIKNRKEVVENMQDKYSHIFCQRCYTSNAFKFEVHHIVFRSEAPKHPQLHSKDNLIIVCDKCHRELHAKKKLRNPLVTYRDLEQKFNKTLIIE